MKSEWTPVEVNPPRKHVFLLSCMDTRLLDDTAHFMNGLNLENRYDQVIFAGSAIGARLLKTPPIECKCKEQVRSALSKHLGKKSSSSNWAPPSTC